MSNPDLPDRSVRGPEIPSNGQPMSTGLDVTGQGVDETSQIDATRRVQAHPPAGPQPARKRSRRSSAPVRQPRQADYSPQSPQPRQQPPQSPQLHPGQPKMRGQIARQDSPWYLPWWSLVMLVAVVGFVAFGLLVLVGSLTSASTPGDQSAQVRVVTAQPTLSQDFIGSSNSAVQPQPSGPTSIPQIVASPTIMLPTPIPSPSLPPGNLSIGTFVTVVGVGGSGLNIRSDPGMAGTLRFLAYDDDTFVLVDGPQSADGLTWWRIEDPNDPSRYGWAARNYLSTTSP